MFEERKIKIKQSCTQKLKLNVVQEKIIRVHQLKQKTKNYSWFSLMSQSRRGSGY